MIQIKDRDGRVVWEYDATVLAAIDRANRLAEKRPKWAPYTVVRTTVLFMTETRQGDINLAWDMLQNGIIQKETENYVEETQALQADEPAGDTRGTEGEAEGAPVASARVSISGLSSRDD